MNQQKPLVPESKQSQVMDPEFEVSIKEYTDTILEKEMKEFTPGVESFNVRVGKIRQEVSDAVSRFRTRYENGYKAILDVLDKLGIKRPQVSEEGLSRLNDREEFRDSFECGEAIYQILGYSSEQMVNFYKAASHYAEAEQYEQARDAFFFLVTIAPDVADFWLALGISYAQLKDLAPASNATLRALELDPTKTDAYLNALHIYVQQNDRDKAQALCQRGIAYALENRDEPWAQKLIACLEEAKNFVIHG